MLKKLSFLFGMIFILAVASCSVPNQTGTSDFAASETPGEAISRIVPTGRALMFQPSEYGWLGESKYSAWFNQYSTNCNLLSDIDRLLLALDANAEINPVLPVPVSAATKILTIENYHVNEQNLRNNTVPKGAPRFESVFFEYGILEFEDIEKPKDFVQLIFDAAQNCKSIKTLTNTEAGPATFEVSVIDSELFENSLSVTTSQGYSTDPSTTSVFRFVAHDDWLIVSMYAASQSNLAYFELTESEMRVAVDSIPGQIMSPTD
jgi:hypothetical protein